MLCPDSQPGSAADSCAPGPWPSHQDKCCGPSPHQSRQPQGDRRGWLCLHRLQNLLPWQPRVQACPALEMSLKLRISLGEQTETGCLLTLAFQSPRGQQPSLAAWADRTGQVNDS